MLVVMEGLDGAGKSTQVKKLRTYLESRCSQLEYIHFPRYDAPVYGELISKFLRGDFGAMESVHPQLVALLYAEDRHGAGPGIKKTLAAGGTVLLDRYVYSNVAYQCAKLKSSDEAEYLREWICDTEFGTFDLPRPDLNIYLDVPIAFIEKNLTSSREGGDRNYLHGQKDIHESDIDFQRKVQAVYRRIASIDRSFTAVDCSDAEGGMLPPDIIFEKVKAVVDSKL